MWDEIKRTDVELARKKLGELRSVTLQRHAEELKQLDADEAEIDTLVRLANTIAEKYLNGDTHTDEGSTAASAIHEATAPMIKQEKSSPAILEGSQNVSPNFGSPLRRLVRR
jgi:hypothetical protein